MSALTVREEEDVMPGVGAAMVHSKAAVSGSREGWVRGGRRVGRGGRRGAYWGR